MKNKSRCVLAFVVLIAMVNLFYYGGRKEGYHVDEVFSYGLANSEYLPFMHFGESGYDVRDWMMEYGAGESFSDLFKNMVKDFNILRENGFRLKESSIYLDYLVAQANSADTRTTTWVSGQEYEDYLTVGKGDTFNYASVYYNQRGDVHPPLYYMLLHTVCSVFLGNFSKWFGLSVNMAALFFTLLLLYHMVSKYLGGGEAQGEASGEALATCVVAAYGLSTGFVSTAMLIRMYALLTLMVVGFCFIHLKIAGEGFQLKGKNRRFLILITLMGFLTHYYFVLYAVALSFVFLVWMAAGKRWESLISYTLTLAITAIFGLGIWPFAVRHVFRGYRGVASLKIIMSGDFYLIKARILLEGMIRQMLGKAMWLLPLSIILALLACLIRRAKVNWGKGCLLVLPVAVYLVVVAQIVPFLVERYVMCIYPFLALFVMGSVYLVGSAVGDRCKAAPEWAQGKLRGWVYRKPWKPLQILAGNYMTVLCILFILLNNSLRILPENLFLGGQELVSVPENTDCVYVLPDGDWNQSAAESLMLAQCRQVAVGYRSSMGCLRGTYEYREGDYLMVAVTHPMDVEEVLAEIKEILGAEALEEAERAYGPTSVRILLRQG